MRICLACLPDGSFVKRLAVKDSEQLSMFLQFFGLLWIVTYIVMSGLGKFSDAESFCNRVECSCLHQGFPWFEYDAGLSNLFS